MQKKVSLMFIFGSLLFSSYCFSGPYDFRRMGKRVKRGVPVSTLEEEFSTEDEFDALVDVAIKRKVLKEEIEFKEPSKFEQMLRKIAPPFFRLYSCSVYKFRAFKKWINALLFGKNSGEQQKETTTQY